MCNEVTYDNIFYRGLLGEMRSFAISVVKLPSSLVDTAYATILSELLYYTVIVML